MAKKVEAGMALSKQGVTISYDSWTDVSHDQLLALAATTSLQPRQVRTVCISIQLNFDFYMLVFIQSSF